MADFTDYAGQKRQRVGEDHQHLWTPNNGYITDLTPTIYDPVQDIVQVDTISPEPTFYNFGITNLNDDNLYSEPSTQLPQQPYGFRDNYPFTNQPFCELSTTTFAADSYNHLEEPERGQGSSQITIEANEDVSLHSSEDRASLQQNPSVICFGMIADISVHCNQTGSLMVDSASLPLKFVKPTSLYHSSTSQTGEFGKLEDRTAKIFENLLVEEGVIIQIYSRNVSKRSIVRTKASKKSGQKTSQSLVNAIIYGPDNLYPLQNDQDVDYRNPHILSRSEKIGLISELEIKSSDAQPRGFDAQDLFSELSKDDHLALTDAPDAVKTELYPHQKKALTFMVQREQAWAFEGNDGDLWVKEADETGGIIYTNLITSSSQTTMPPESRGGLLADKMGLGKSLTMISLIALNPAQCKEPLIFTPQGTIRRVKSTLIVVPYSLLETWDTQLSRHLKPRTLSWIRFHGHQKRKMLSFSNNDIVITTYQTLVRQQIKHKDPEYGGDTLFSFAWHRIVLDEAHTIRNRATSMAQACGAVLATSRWAMTGTPIQNRVTDFASLLEYLHIQPFSSPKIFESEITKPCFEPENPDTTRLRKIVNCVSLCRTKAVIALPERRDEICYLEFSLSERKYYDTVKLSTIQKMDEALAHNPLNQSQYLNALQWLNELRLICNHGLTHCRKTPENLTAVVSPDEPWNNKTGGKAFETLVKAGQALCSLCSANITEGTGEAANSELPKPSLSKCLTLICGSCIQSGPGGQKLPTCPCRRKCPKVDVSWAPESVETRLEKSPPMIKEGEVPTKLKALLERLQRCPKEEKSVVFSYWTSTLDLAEILLEEANIAFTRIDGKRSGHRRDEAVRRLEEDENIQVILVSITCGGTGLDLTAASCAYLLEPQWNPMMEEQALSRIHRMGQKKEVRTVKFRIRNSFEEKIIHIQESKRDLAAWAFSDEERAEVADGAARLQALRERFR